MVSDEYRLTCEVCGSTADDVKWDAIEGTGIDICVCDKCRKEVNVHKEEKIK